jgi:S1-C subfamily serine protease
MTDILSSLSSQLAQAAGDAAASVVQVGTRRRPVAGLVFAEDLVVTPAGHLDEDTTIVRRSDGHTAEGSVLGRSPATGLAVVRVPNLGVPPARPAAEPQVGHLAIAVGRTWSGAVFARLTSVAVVGGPLRTGRTTEITRVIRIDASPHGALTGGVLSDGDGRALGIITAGAIRGTTVVVPIALVSAAAQDVVSRGGARQGFIGVSSAAVRLPERQRASRPQEYGLVVTGLVEGGPADTASLLVGDVIVGFEGETIQEPEQLVIRLRGDRVGKPVALTIVRGGVLQDVSVTVGERQR